MITQSVVGFIRIANVEQQASMGDTTRCASRLTSSCGIALPAGRAGNLLVNSSSAHRGLACTWNSFFVQAACPSDQLRPHGKDRVPAVNRS